MTIHRRSLILGLVSSLTAPAIVHAGNIMPVHLFRSWSPDDIPGLIHWSRFLEEDGTLAILNRAEAGTAALNWWHHSDAYFWRPESVYYNRILNNHERAKIQKYLTRNRGRPTPIAWLHESTYDNKRVTVCAAPSPD